MTKRQNHSVSRGFRLFVSVGLIAVFCLAAVSVLVLNPPKAHAQTTGCSPSTSYGTDSLTINIPITATYYVWLRMNSPDGINDQLMMSVNNGTCYTMDESETITPVPTNAWEWVNTQSGSSAPVTLSLSPGDDSFVFTGNEPGVGLDEIQLLTEPPGTGTGECTPVGTTNNCITGSYDPSVNVTALPTLPDGNGAVHGKTQAIDATATPNNGGSISNCKLDANSSTLQTIGSSPYHFNLDTLSANGGSAFPDGDLSLQVSCTDNQGDVGIQPLSAEVNNGDLTDSGTVGLSDLSIMAAPAHWHQIDPNYADGNITGQSTINISDLAVLVANWGWVN